MIDEKVAAKLMLGWVRDALTKAVAAERARCAAVCRARAEKHRKTAAEETAAAEYGEALESGVTAREADACAEAIERGAVER
jgi:hypothetical protein